MRKTKLIISEISFYILNSNCSLGQHFLRHSLFQETCLVHHTNSPKCRKDQKGMTRANSLKHLKFYAVLEFARRNSATTSDQAVNIIFYTIFITIFLCNLYYNSVLYYNIKQNYFKIVQR